MVRGMLDQKLALEPRRPAVSELWIRTLPWFMHLRKGNILSSKSNARVFVRSQCTVNPQRFALHKVSGQLTAWEPGAWERHTREGRSHPSPLLPGPAARASALHFVLSLPAAWSAGEWASYPNAV